MTLNLINAFETEKIITGWINWITSQTQKWNFYRDKNKNKTDSSIRKIKRRVQNGIKQLSLLF